MKLPRASSVLTLPLFVLSLLALGASFVLPVHGLGPPACGFHVATGRPCPGCGMTRAVSAISQLEPEIAWHYHPFAFVIWPLMTIMALAAVIPPFRRFLLDRVIERHDLLVTRLFWGSVLVFLLYGVWRIITEPYWPLG